MDEKKNDIASDVSSGAEKVKNIEKNVFDKQADTVKNRVEEEKKNAEKRVSAAKKKAKEKGERVASKARQKERKLEKKLAAKEKRAERVAQRKERTAKRRAERAERKDLLKNETAVQRLERKERERLQRLEAREKAAARRHELLLKKKEDRLKRKENRLSDRRHKREERTKRTRERAPGFGGWLAAVISLGVVSLVMATVVTAGAMNLADMNSGMISSYQDDIYELDGAADNMQTALSKLRVSSSAADQSRLLADLLVNCEIAECDLEHIPVDGVTSANISAFVNKTSAFCRRALAKLASGEPLGESDRNTLDYLYKVSTEIRSELDQLAVTMTSDDIVDLVKGKENGTLSSGFSGVAKGTTEVPDTITDGPFADSVYKVNAKGLSSYEEISSSEGKKLVERYLDSYDVENVECTGEATISGFTCYNYEATDARGRSYFVQLSEQGGKLVMLDSYEMCKANNYDIDECIAIAEEFLERCGFENVKPVYFFETGTTADINFCYEQDGVVVYADMVKVKVCETRGCVTGVEAYSYWMNHSERSIGSAKATVSDVRGKFPSLDITSTRLAYIPLDGEETLCYEVVGRYGGEEYYIYFDAATAKEVAVFTVENSDAGRILK